MFLRQGLGLRVKGLGLGFKGLGLDGGLRFRVFLGYKFRINLKFGAVWGLGFRMVSGFVFVVPQNGGPIHKSRCQLVYGTNPHPRQF